MIGYYVHHHGSGHLHRALAINRVARVEMTGLSSLPRPSGWTGDWLRLPLDVDGVDGIHAAVDWDITANGRLHYVPLASNGLRRRMSMISGWIDREQPGAVVVDVSVEVALAVRLHGIPVLVVAQPGHRGDPAHRLGYDVASSVIALWPRRCGELWDAAGDDIAKTHFVGALSRYSPSAPATRDGRRRVVVLNGTGGPGVDPAGVERARSATPGWEWVVLDRAHGTWVDDPWPVLCSATVVISHAGQNAIAEIAAARRPALLLPQDRPFDEQRMMAAALAADAELPVLIRDRWPSAQEWPELLRQLDRLDGANWFSWLDGEAAERVARLLWALEPGRAVAS